MRIRLFCLALGLSALPGLIHANTTLSCNLIMMCAGVWDNCDATDGPARVDIAPDLITVTALNDTFRFDEIVRAFGAPETSIDALTASGLNTTATPVRYLTLVLGDGRVGVIVSEDQDGTGHFRANLSFLAECGT
jgi:hypothetical protein